MRVELRESESKYKNESESKTERDSPTQTESKSAWERKTKAKRTQSESESDAQNNYGNKHMGQARNVFLQYTKNNGLGTERQSENNIVNFHMK